MTTFQPPREIDLQRALAFITGWARHDSEVEKIWEDAVSAGRDFMLLCAVVMLLVKTSKPNLENNPAALARLAHIVGALAVMGDDEDKDAAG